MTFSTFIFYVFAAILIFAALRVVTTRNPVHAALWLVLCFFTAAGVWLLLHAEFLAIALVLVYVGAVMVLFLFVVMMLDVNFDGLRKNFRSYIPVGATVGLLVLLEMALVVVGSKVAGDIAPPAPGGQQHEGARPPHLRGLRVPVRDRRRRAARGDHRRDRADAPQAPRIEVPGPGAAGEGAPAGPHPAARPARGKEGMTVRGRDASGRRGNAGTSINRETTCRC